MPSLIVVVTEIGYCQVGDYDCDSDNETDRPRAILRAPLGSLTAWPRGHLSQDH